MTATQPPTGGANLDDNAALLLAHLLHKAGQPDTTTTGGSSVDPLGQSILDRAMNKSAETDTAAAVAPTDASSDTTSASPVPEGTPVNQPYGGAHPGIDLGVPLDTRISSAIAGKVTVLSVNGDAGLQIGVQGPDGTLTLYDHMHSADVALGSTVKAGQPIGTSGGEAGGATSGNSTGAHLHFEVRDASGQTVDPTPWLAGGHPIVGAAPADITTVVDPVSAQGANLLDIARGQHPTDSGQTKTTPGAKATGTGSTDDADPGAIDSFLAAIRQKESNNNYQVRNTSGLSNAAGAYQFIGTTWQGLGGSTASAADASPAEQDAIARAYAMQLFNTYHSWRLAAIAWYQPSAADAVARGEDPGAPAGQGRFIDYGDSIAQMMQGGGK